MASDRARKPTLIDGRLANVSPSQLKTFTLCPRKWYFEKIKKYAKKPTGKGAEYGTKCHAQIEQYLLTGARDFLPPVLAGIGLIDTLLPRAPCNGGDIEVEAAIEDAGLTLAGVKVTGFIDLVIPPIGTTPPLIIDHKFRADVGKYAETAEELESDPQAVIYSLWAFRRWPDSKRVDFAHYNYQTQRPYGTTVVQVSTTAKDMPKKEKALAEKVSEMSRLALLSRPEQVSCNTKACSAFGGCDFAAQCADSPNNRVMSMFNGSNMGFLDKMKAGEVKQEEQPTQAAQVAVEEAPKKKRRAGITPPESQIALPVQPAQSAPAATVQPPAEKVMRKEVHELLTAELPSHMTMVVVDCAISGFSPQRLNVLAQEAADMLARDNELSDIRLAPNTSALAYGGWKVYLAKECIRRMKLCADGTVFEASSGGIVDPVLEALYSDPSVKIIKGGLK